MANHQHRDLGEEGSSVKTAVHGSALGGAKGLAIKIND